MAEPAQGNSNSIPVWVALVAAIATVGGYLIGYYKDLEIQARKERQEFILELLREDPKESSANLLWADEADLIELSTEAKEALQESPESAPVRSITGNNVFVAPEEAGVGALPADANALVIALDSKLYRERYAALEALELRHAADPVAIQAALASLSDGQIDRLSANGRYNVIYFLDRVSWTRVDSSLVEATRKTIQGIEDRDREGIAEIGPKTQALIDSVKRQLAKL